MSTGSAHAAETNDGTVTSWLPLTEPWSPPAQCYSTFLADSGHLVLFNPSLGGTFSQLAWCLPGEITASYNQPYYDATTTNLGPFICPNQFVAASKGSSLGIGTTAINCCPPDFTWVTIQTSQYCTSSLAAGQTITYVPASSSTITSSILSTASYALAYQVYGFDFDPAVVSTSSPAPSTTSTSSSSSSSSAAAIVIATGTPTPHTISSASSTSTDLWFLSPSTAVAVPPPTASATTKTAMSGANIGGIVAGTAIACIAIIAAFLLLLRHHRRAMEEVYGHSAPINALEQRRNGGDGGVAAAAAEKEMSIDKGKGVAMPLSAHFARGNAEAASAKLNSYERPELVGGTEMDAIPICELHGDSKPFELVGSR